MEVCAGIPITAEMDPFPPDGRLILQLPEIRTSYMKMFQSYCPPHSTFQLVNGLLAEPL